ncbi:MAG: hypothetical protein AAGE52_38790 [Myxococcota bacterium]
MVIERPNLPSWTVLLDLWERKRSLLGAAALSSSMLIAGCSERAGPREMDAGADVGADVGATDAGTDAGSDAAADADTDAGTDAASDVGVDAPSDAGVDARDAPDAAPDAAMDAALDAPRDAMDGSLFDAAIADVRPDGFTDVGPDAPDGFALVSARFQDGRRVLLTFTEAVGSLAGVDVGQFRLSWGQEYGYSYDGYRYGYAYYYDLADGACLAYQIEYYADYTGMARPGSLTALDTECASMALDIRLDVAAISAGATTNTVVLTLERAITPQALQTFCDATTEARYCDGRLSTIEEADETCAGGTQLHYRPATMPLRSATGTALGAFGADFVAAPFAPAEAPSPLVIDPARRIACP